MRLHNPEAFRDFLRQQVAVLETALARPALDMEINPARPLMPLGRAKPILLSLRQTGPRQAGLGERKTSQSQSKSAPIDGMG
jgi:hypothetical protein